MKELLKKLNELQKKVKPITKEADNPFFRSKYATLDAIQHHIKPHLTELGLVVTQGNIIEGGQPYVKTIVWDLETGQSIDSVFPVVVSKSSAQEYGSAVSYAKRYSLSGLLNLIIQDEDDDGEAAEGRNNKADDKPWLNDNTEAFQKAKSFIQSGGSINDIRKKYNISKKVAELLNK